MAAKTDNRYDIREEADGTWTVFDTRPIHGGESRIMYGITETRARQYLERLNRRKAVLEADVEQDTGLIMPGLNDSFFFVAFVDDGRGQAVPASEPAQASSEAEAIRCAKELEPSSVGVVAWSRHAQPAIGEIGPPVIIYSAGRIGDFD